MKMANLSIRDSAGSTFAYEIGRSAFSAVSEIAELNSALRVSGRRKKTTASRQYQGVSLLCDACHCLLRASMQ